MIDIQVVGIPQVQRTVNVLLDRLLDFDYAWDDLIRELLRPRTVDQFETEGQGRWKPRQDNLPHPLLRKTGKLFDSYVDEHAEGHVDNRSPHSLEWGSDLDYGQFHETGTRYLPQRSVLEFAENDAFGQQVADILERELERGLQ